ncbi:MAG: type transport system permease protein [Actinomycetota bacterium]|jgi:ABC-2 type transport system permease protein|nr:type transport system permease protein [Actinomycetota bacterium]
MSAATYARYEVLRTFRNRRFFIMSLIFPLVLFYLVAGSQRDMVNFAGTGLSFRVYYMAGMVSWGTMAAVIAGGARIAAERSIGWNRQLRLTPLAPRTYFAAKVFSGYLMAVVSIVLLYGAGLTLGVNLSAGAWLRMTGLILVGLVPFAALGVLIGHLLTGDSLGPALGGITSLAALLGGAWGPIFGNSGFLNQVVQLVPSYWLVQAGQSAITTNAWPAKAWIVVAVWTVVLTRLAMTAYRRDTARA